MKIRVLAMLVAFAAGCGGVQSNYTRARVAPGELVWRYDNKFQVVAHDGRVVGENGDWGSLVPAVSCVPEAGDWASSAARRDRIGKILQQGGAIVMLAAVAGGTYLALSDIDDTDRMLDGLALMGGGLVFGLATVPTGSIMRVRANARAVDAVNRYNDEVWAGRCTR